VPAQLAQNLHLKRTFALSQRVDAAIEKLTLAKSMRRFANTQIRRAGRSPGAATFKGP
jgi:hypothetical protein